MASEHADEKKALPIVSQVRIGHVDLKVADLERAIAFYRDLLGFELTQRYGRQVRIKYLQSTTRSLPSHNFSFWGCVAVGIGIVFSRTSGILESIKP